MDTTGNIRRFTNFSIDEILKPSFGLKDVKQFLVKLEESESSACATETMGAETSIKIESLEDRLTGNHESEDRIRKGQKFHDIVSTEQHGRPSSTCAPQIPAWVFCTRYSDRPSAGPRSKRQCTKSSKENRHRTSFTRQQINHLTEAFDTCPYLTEITKDRLTKTLKMEESHIKIWFQNKRAKLKRENGRKSALAIELSHQGLYNHQPIQSTVLCPTR